MEYISDAQAKQMILEVGRRMYQGGFVAANDGNISCKVGDNGIWATPTGVSKGFMTEDMLVKLDLDGNVLEGTHKSSSEIKMHLRVFKENPKVQGVVHAHPLTATAFACAGISLEEPVLMEGVLSLGCVPLVHFALPGTEEVPEAVAPYCREYNAVLLANHGALTWGDNLMQAYYRMETTEYYAKILMMNNFILGRRCCPRDRSMTSSASALDGVLPRAADPSDRRVRRIWRISVFPGSGDLFFRAY